MDTTCGTSFKSESAPIKKEPGTFIKSEFQPSFASLPQAPTSAGKKEQTGDKKSAVAGIPERRHRRGRDRGGEYRRRRGGNSLVHRVDGYHIRAHYGHGKVDFTIIKDGNKTRELKWMEVEREMFRKFHGARFYIEPIERPGRAALQYCSASMSGTLEFSVRVRQVPARPASSERGDHSNRETATVNKDAKGMEDKAFLRSDSGSFAPKASQFAPRFPEASLPAHLPDADCRFTNSYGVHYWSF